MNGKLRLGISSCLLGNKVRYDGQHKLDPFLAETLGRYVEFVPVCPEVECGLGIPRPAMRLIGTVEDHRLVTINTGVDHTERMRTWARGRVRELAGENLCGYIFKAKSPSSGMERVKVYNDKGAVIGSTSGLFAAAFMREFPLLPVEDEGRLHDPDLRENFIERVFTLDRYRRGPAAEGTARSLMAFQAAHKLLIMSHSPANVAALGRLASAADRRAGAAVLGAYEALLLKTVALQATVAKHVNVLQHMQGYFKTVLAADEKAELMELIAQYRSGLVPLIVPVTLFRHYARKYAVGYLQGQVYLDPHPLELKLRNHA
jgi:uncharacterized protein YbbK (DUF523 family)/uncharacterized protein YbgA (DUF1722 family)